VVVKGGGGGGGGIGERFLEMVVGGGGYVSCKSGWVGE